MRYLVALILFVLPAISQVAADANKNYSSVEGRERMVKVLSSPGRAKRLNPENLVQSLNLKPGATVADLGTGAGFLLPYLAKAVGPAGKIIAVDIHDDFLDAARKTAAEAQLTNISFQLSTERDPQLDPGAADLIIAVDAYHHFNYPEQMLAGIRRALSPNGRFVIVDYYKDGFRDPDHIRLDKDDAIKEITANGFRLTANHEHIPDEQYRIEFVAE
ncbi:MAG: class I SAM-dependent methyltransferase [bacterium]|nr:class I SAM-dependent methyltransferase [bacterium]